MSKKEGNPYTNNPTRLTDVIAAIQAMGNYKFYNLSFSKWAHRICGDKEQGMYWKEIFEQHPEFFRLNKDQDKASLVWRRNYTRRYDVDEEETIGKEEYGELTKEQKKRISRNPLPDSGVSTLISAAIDIHSRELDRKKASRWWVPVLVTLISVITGAIIGFTAN